MPKGKGASTIHSGKSRAATLLSWIRQVIAQGCRLNAKALRAGKQRNRVHGCKGCRREHMCLQFELSGKFKPKLSTRMLVNHLGAHPILLHSRVFYWKKITHEHTNANKMLLDMHGHGPRFHLQYSTLKRKRRPRQRGAQPSVSNIGAISVWASNATPHTYPHNISTVNNYLSFSLVRMQTKPKTIEQMAWVLHIIMLIWNIIILN